MTNEEKRTEMIRIMKDYNLIDKLGDSANTTFKCSDLLIFIEDKLFDKEICKLIEAEKLINEVRNSIAEQFEEVLD